MPSKSVEITNGTLAALASREDARAALPVLFGRLDELSKKAAASCQKCTAARNRTLLDAEYARIKLAISALGAESLATLKRLLDTEQVTIMAGKTHTGVPVKHVR